MNKLCVVFLYCFSITTYAYQTNDSIKKWKVKGKLTFVFNQSSFSNWVSGGNNTVSGNLGLNYDFNYKKGKWNWDNKFISTYGLSYISGEELRKTSDQIEFNP